MKRITIYLLLLCMTLHCASRLGVLSYIYENRHEIAYRIGMAVEIPIAMCSSDFDFDRGFHIHELKDESSTLPTSGLLQAREIHLFIEPSIIDTHRQLSLIKDNPFPFVIDQSYSPPDFPVFHPPV